MKVHKSVLERRKWEKFGLAVTGTLEDGASVSSSIGEPVQFEYVNAKKKEEKKKMEVKKEEVKVEEKVEDKKDEKKEEPKKKSYVPPSLRGTIQTNGMTGIDTKPSYRERDDSNTIRISNLAEDVTESDLRDMFNQCGMIQRVYLATDKETGQSKGFAFITYRFEDAVDVAIQKFDGKGLHHMILSVERSKPSVKK